MKFQKGQKAIVAKIDDYELMKGCISEGDRVVVTMLEFVGYTGHLDVRVETIGDSNRSMWTNSGNLRLCLECGDSVRYGGDGKKYIYLGEEYHQGNQEVLCSLMDSEGCVHVVSYCNVSYIHPWEPKTGHFVLYGSVIGVILDVRGSLCKIRLINSSVVIEVKKDELKFSRYKFKEGMSVLYEGEYATIEFVEPATYSGAYCYQVSMSDGLSWADDTEVEEYSSLPPKPVEVILSHQELDTEGPVQLKYPCLRQDSCGNIVLYTEESCYGRIIGFTKDCDDMSQLMAQVSEHAKYLWPFVGTVSITAK